MFHDDKTDLVYSGVVNLGSEMFAALLQTSTMELFEIIVGNITLKLSQKGPCYICDWVQDVHLDTIQFLKFQQRYLPDSK